MIIEKNKLSVILKNYLPNADSETIERLTNQVQVDADTILLSMIMHAISEEGTPLYLH
ncbi:MAG: hypothetical protein H6Q74_1116 [Firmicutes bacterium]|nr:hypothetical protein [Bacillota bacterium]